MQPLSLWDRPRWERRTRATDAVTAELVRWAHVVDPGPDASAAQRAAARQAVIELADEPDDLHRAWTEALRMLARGEVTRSVVSLLAEATGDPEVAASA